MLTLHVGEHSQEGKPAVPVHMSSREAYLHGISAAKHAHLFDSVLHTNNYSFFLGVQVAILQRAEPRHVQLMWWPEKECVVETYKFDVDGRVVDHPDGLFSEVDDAYAILL